jgi:formylglycine-generating enzyme required for sulfatase activity
LLRRWGERHRLDTIVAALRPKAAHASVPANDAKRWFVNSQGQTFVVINIDKFQMGSPEPERRKEESPHVVHVGRRIAMAATPVTRLQYAAFQRVAKCRDLANDPGLRDIVTTDDSPQTAMTWYEAAQYCNWLSREEGLPECYEPNSSGEFGPGMHSADGYLQSAGYRLPTEAEWEFACRASTATSRYYGSSESLLPNYAWYLANEGNQTRPVAGLKPNDFGLFDMLGNAFQLCDDLYCTNLTNAAEDGGWTSPVVDSEGRSMRGASYLSHARLVRSAYRNNSQPAYRTGTIGFRVARTLP